MTGDALAMKITCSGGDGCRFRTCGPTKKVPRDVLTNLRGTFGEASPMHRRLFGDAYFGSDFNFCLIGLITVIGGQEAKLKILMLNLPRATPRRRQTSTILLAVAQKILYAYYFNNMYHYIWQHTHVLHTNKTVPITTLNRRPISYEI